jgi:hypothetical protein
MDFRSDSISRRQSRSAISSPLGRNWCLGPTASLAGIPYLQIKGGSDVAGLSPASATFSRRKLDIRFRR